MARKLVEQDKVDFIIGPLSGSEGIAMRDFAKTIPDKVVINGISGGLRRPGSIPRRTSTASTSTARNGALASAATS